MRTSMYELFYWQNHSISQHVLHRSIEEKESNIELIARPEEIMTGNREPLAVSADESTTTVVFVSNIRWLITHGVLDSAIQNYYVNPYLVTSE
jgi:hypothetical protein